MTMAGPVRGYERVEAALVGAGAASLYLGTLARNMGAAHDSIFYMSLVDRHATFFHPHHLLAHWAAHGWCDLWQRVLPDVETMLLVESLNAIAGGAAIGIFYLILRMRLRLDPVSALLGSLLPALSFGVWFYSTAIEVYIIPIAFLLMALYVLTAEMLTLRSFVAAGVTCGLAVLFHQAYALFLPAVILAATARRRTERPGTIGALAAYAVTSGVLVAVPYAIVIYGVLGLRNSGEIGRWITQYAHEGFWLPPGVSTLVHPVVGFARSIVGLHFLMGGTFQSAIRRVFPSKWLDDEAFLVRDVPPLLGYVLLALSIFAAMLCVWLVARRWRAIRPTFERVRPTIIVTLGWLIPFSTFFVFWEPSNVEFWIPQSICVWLLAIALWAEPREGRAALPLAPVAVLASALAVTNYFGSIRGLTSQEHDYNYMKIRPVVEQATEQDLVVIGPSWLTDLYMARYSRARCVASIQMDPGAEPRPALLIKIRESMAATLRRGGRIFLSADAVYLSREAQRWVGADDPGAAVWKEYEGRWRSVSNGVGTYYLIEPASSNPTLGH